MESEGTSEKVNWVSCKRYVWLDKSIWAWAFRGCLSWVEKIQWLLSVRGCFIYSVQAVQGVVLTELVLITEDLTEKASFQGCISFI